MCRTANVVKNSEPSYSPLGAMRWIISPAKFSCLPSLREGSPRIERPCAKCSKQWHDHWQAWCRRIGYVIDWSVIYFCNVLSQSNLYQKKVAKKSRKDRVLLMRHFLHTRRRRGLEYHPRGEVGRSVSVKSLLQTFARIMYICLKSDVFSPPHKNNLGGVCYH